MSFTHGNNTPEINRIHDTIVAADVELSHPANLSFAQRRAHDYFLMLISLLTRRTPSMPRAMVTARSI